MEETNRLAVNIEGNVVKLYINDEFKEEIRQANYSGGKVGLAVFGVVGRRLVVDFDDFEFRRRHTP